MEECLDNSAGGNKGFPKLTHHTESKLQEEDGDASSGLACTPRNAGSASLWMQRRSSREVAKPPSGAPYGDNSQPPHKHRDLMTISPPVMPCPPQSQAASRYRQNSRGPKRGMQAAAANETVASMGKNCPPQLLAPAANASVVAIAADTKTAVSAESYLGRSAPCFRHSMGEPRNLPMLPTTPTIAKQKKLDMGAVFQVIETESLLESITAHEIGCRTDQDRPASFSGIASTGSLQKRSPSPNQGGSPPRQSAIQSARPSCSSAGKSEVLDKPFGPASPASTPPLKLMSVSHPEVAEPVIVAPPAHLYGKRDGHSGSCAYGEPTAGDVDIAEQEQLSEAEASLNDCHIKNCLGVGAVADGDIVPSSVASDRPSTPLPDLATVLDPMLEEVTSSHKANSQNGEPGCSGAPNNRWFADVAFQQDCQNESDQTSNLPKPMEHAAICSSPEPVGQGIQFDENPRIGRGTSAQVHDPVARPRTLTTRIASRMSGLLELSGQGAEEKAAEDTSLTESREVAAAETSKTLTTAKKQKWHNFKTFVESHLGDVGASSRESSASSCPSVTSSVASGRKCFLFSQTSRNSSRSRYECSSNYCDSE